MRVGITMGDPAGIGAEVALLLLEELGPDAPVTFFGSELQMEAGAAAIGMAPPLPVQVLPGDAVDDPRSFEGGPKLVNLADLEPADVKPGVSTPAGASAQLRYVSIAAQAAQTGRIAALVTGPMSKSAVTSVMGTRFPGQTELFARLGGLHSRDVVMAFTGDRIRTALVTNHLPLIEVPKHLTGDRIARVCRLEIEHLQLLGIERPRLAVAAFNPHGGEHGLFGSEERQLITPAVAALDMELRSERSPAVVSGPFPVDTAFRLHAAGKFDAVIAMFHDQAMIATRLLGFGDSVNVTLGLPYVRTSPDHGTAYDIAGTGRADGRGMYTAYRLARKLVRSRQAREPVAVAPA